MDLIIKLLNKDRNVRMGTKAGAKEILEHDLFKGWDISKIYNKTQEPPFMPEMSEDNQMQFFNMDSGKEAI